MTADAPRTPVRRRAFLLAVSGLVALPAGAALTGCGPNQSGAAAAGAGDGPTSTPAPSAPPAEVTLAGDGFTADGPVSPRPVLRASVTGGTLTGITLTGPDGAPVAVTASPDGSATPADDLDLGASYTASASATNADGATATGQLAFTTVAESGAVRAKMMPLDGEVVGVGMPVVVIFTSDVPKAERQGVTDAITLDSGGVEGAWRWIGADRVHWRPKEYWPSGTKVRVQVPLTKMQVDGRWGAADRDVAFTIGDSHVATADTNTHEMTVRVNGEVAKVIPISAGREDSDPAFVTRSGVHLVLEKHEDYLMDGRTVGQDYATQVKWATRIANSGEFVHGAPWSVPSQGKRNVSHGCLNVSDANAKWFFGIAQRGDVVDVTGTDRPMELTNGLGDWVLSWEQWTAPQT